MLYAGRFLSAWISILNPVDPGASALPLCSNRIPTIIVDQRQKYGTARIEREIVTYIRSRKQFP